MDRCSSIFIRLFRSMSTQDLTCAMTYLKMTYSKATVIMAKIAKIVASAKVKL